MIREMKEPDEFLKMVWDLNEKYPDYVTCLKFDHASAPTYDMEQAQQIFRKKLERSVDKVLLFLKEKIEIFEEEGFDTSELVALRKKFRSYKDLNLIDCSTVEALEMFFPSDLKEFLLKI